MTLHSIEQEKKINTMASELAEIKALLLQKKIFFNIDNAKQPFKRNFKRLF